MNIFVSIEIAIPFRKVTYYTVRFENEKLSEFEKFVENHKDNKEIRNEYQDLMALIKNLGNQVGAKSRYFSRKEKRAEALPPYRKNYSESEKKLYVKCQHNLRLYCMRISDEIVFLFNGGIKTPGSITAQECERIRKFFNYANLLAKKVEEGISGKEIRIKGMNLEVDDDFELMVNI